MRTHQRQLSPRTDQASRSSEGSYVGEVSIFPRPHFRHLVRVLAFATGALVMSTALEVPASAATVTTSSVLAAAKAAITEQSGVHVTITFTASSSSSPREAIADLGKQSGVDVLSLGKATVTFKLTPAYVYVSGNSSGLTTIFGLNSAQAKKLGKDWISVNAGSSEYSSLKSSLTISSVTGVLPAAKGTKLSTEIHNGAKLDVLKWTIAATSSGPKASYTLTVPAKGPTLPIEEIGTASNGGKETSLFSRWGERVVVKAPPASSTITSSKITG